MTHLDTRAQAREIEQHGEWLLGASQALVGADGHDVAALALAAHALEMGLKAFLLTRGACPEAPNLRALWVEAVGRGLGLRRQPPDWCITLDAYSSYPYGLRCLPDEAEALERADLCIGEVRRALAVVQAELR